jgi:hypothetical protein
LRGERLNLTLENIMAKVSDAVFEPFESARAGYLEKHPFKHGEIRIFSN